MRRLLLISAFLTLAFPAAGSAQSVPGAAVPARETEPVVMTGELFGDWAVPANVNAKLPAGDVEECTPGVDPSQIGDGLSAFSLPEDCPHNEYAEPDAETGEIVPGTPIDRLIGFRWDAAGKRWQEIPFQVDERFTRYLDNSASGFSPYSGQDQHTTYAYDGPSDREGFRWHGQEAGNPCMARPVAPGEGEVGPSDPVTGFDTNDEVAFMATDAGPAAPAGTPLPRGIEAARQIAVTDPAGLKEPGFVYVMRAKADGPRPSFGADNGYVRYERDADANVFHFSQSSYDDYGNARKGKFWDPETGTCRGANISDLSDAQLEACKEIDRPNETGFYDCPQRRRPNDRATIKTDRYEFRYDGRWLMTSIRIKDEDDAEYGPDVVDRWKARAFAQDPGSETPCCGFEEEDTNWGGSSTLLGERVGPVRAIRETWGADSGTNVIRRETFYREEMRQHTFLRVHVIPPLDGIYAQWDFNAGRMTKFFNTVRPEGVDVDGRNDEAYGNFDDPCNANYDANDTSDVDQGYREAYWTIPGLCQELFGQTWPYHQSVDAADLSFSQANAALEWSQTSGPHGTIIDRTTSGARDITPGGAAQSVVALPYYRDDSCFDDGTGTNPGPKLKLRSGDEPRTYEGAPRKCWTTEDGVVDGDPRFYQGSIATHGLHIMFLVDSDNARTQVPVNEINAEQRMVFLPGDQGGNVGEQYGRSFEKPLVAATLPFADGGEEAAAPGPDPEPQPQPGGGDGNGDGGPGNDNGNQSQNGNGGGQGNGGPAGASRDQGAVRGAQAERRCLPARVRARKGWTRKKTLSRLGPPTSRRGSAYTWCRAGGGKLVVVFERGRAAKLRVTR